jgi:hypothetical protein
MAKPIRFETRLKLFPPIWIRLAASAGSGAHRYWLSDEEIVERSGLALAFVKGLSWSVNWDGIPVQHVFAFLRGCNIDLEDRATFKRLKWMMKHGRLTHLRRAGDATNFEAMLNHWAGL